ncbi:uncharacterized protein K489DRAFT_318674 [Dissoconium aciculare CBS 342.82]|uniref:F-box domain-containing protein n=1 Tax=Dissoconium aciculare CBS 342.82 TaxID=1314786 RepID=A0A6J3M5U7_9PEZI|nr:uncharacterized protein K489DRAFT_318674 [Dissoconium aciculare CBS 342.82]KAF1822904.1 hypothetical protein K489DRAFT_318674 [Dissoconium aciculare CBS 342.82]
MGFLKHFRSKARLRDNSNPKAASYPELPYVRYGRDYTRQLPDAILARIFAYVCPHVADTTYEPCESSQIGEGCMLCDLRELAECARLCRKWRAVAERQLYKSIRIDAVHYCQREYDLAEIRKKKHYRAKSGDKFDPAAIRLALLCRSVWDRPDLARRTEFLKVTYMTRETAKADLARTVAAMPNLKYVDLPDGFFNGDSSCTTLRQELQSRCPDLRKMTYRHGAEAALQLIPQGYWQNLEILELTSIVVEPATLRIVLAGLPNLFDLSLTDMSWLDDSMLQPLLPQLPNFPPVRVLKLVDTPHITTQGLQSWLDKSGAHRSLFSLSLQNTGVTVQDLHTLLQSATHLDHLSIDEVISTSLGLAMQQLPPLSSRSLTKLHFEISNAEDIQALQKPAESYYAYLSSSLHANALPNLATLYVRDPTFADLLVLPPIVAPFAGGPGGTGGGPGGGFNQTLEIFSKGMDESEWVFTSIMPPDGRANRDSTILVGGRPLSAYSASRGLGPQWAQGGFGGEARRSVIVGNGFGGFLAVPAEEAPRPMTSDGGNGGGGGFSPRRFSFFRSPPKFAGAEGRGHERRGSKRDLWR